MPDERLQAWIRQARADLEAGQAPGASECHRRYWLQQACEKGIKALGLILWAGLADDARLRQHFLHRHSPLKQLAAEVAADPAIPKSLLRLLRELEVELRQLDGGVLLRKVDSTTPTTAPTEASYRYPFQDHGVEVAPVDWTAADWDAYQGNFVGVVASVDRFLRLVENRRQRGRSMGRTPPGSLLESPWGRARFALRHDGITGHTGTVKAAISIPDDLFREIDARARALNLSRSAFLARAAREFLEGHRPTSNATDAWNKAIERGGQPGDERGPVAARRRTKAVLRGKARRR